MKSKRVNLEENKVDNTLSNVTTVRMMKLRDKHMNLKQLEMSQNVRNISDVFEVNNISHIFQRNDENFNSMNISIMKTPVNLNGLDYSYNNTGMITKDETSEKEIIKTDYFNEPPREVNKVFTNFFPVQIEFPSQISFENNLTESENPTESQCLSFTNSCNLGEFCECSDCDRGYDEYDEDLFFQEENLISKFQTPLPIKLNLRSPNDYKDFGLILNSQIVQSPSDQTHQLLPYRFKNDESYKMKLFRYLRKPQFKENKTVTCKFNVNEKRKFSDAFNLPDYNEITLKKRKITSERKIFEAEHSFKDDRVKCVINGNKLESSPTFKFYSDKEIGFSTDWQRQLKETEMDDDVETDDDQLKAANRHVMRELGDGIKAFIKNRRNVRNFALMKFN